MSERRSVPLKRRTFLKAAGLAGGALALGAGADLLNRPGHQTPTAQAAGPITEFYSSCSMECLHCSLIAEVQDGKIVNIKGNKKYVTQPCLRGLSRAQWVYSKDRILYPMKRVGERGSGKWERISWDEALDTIASKIKEVKEKVGPKGYCYVAGSGNFASLAGGVPRAFWTHLGGVTSTVGSLCCSAVGEAMNNMMGFRTEFRDTWEQSRYIICWGNNPAVTNQGWYHKITAAVEAGAKLVVIDPRYSETAAKAHEWVPIKPGTDTALAMGMLRVIITEKLYDEKFLLEKTGAVFLLKDGNQALDPTGKPLVMDTATGKTVPYDTAGVVPALSLPRSGEYETVYDLIAREVAPFTPQETERITSVPAAVTVRLAREWAATKPAAIIQNMSGAQRNEFGTYTVVSQLYLATFTGNWGFPGAGVNDTGGVTQILAPGAPVPSAKVDPIPTIPVSKLGEYLVEEKPHKVHLLWVGSSSIMTQYPNTNKIKEALLKVPFVVAANNVWASHTNYADIVLPVTTLWESVDVVASIRSRYVQLMDKGVEPQGEAKSDAWIFGKLATRLGFGEQFDRPEEELANNVLKPYGITVADLRKNGPYLPFPEGWIPWKDGVFKTSTKRFHLFVPAWQQKKLSPVVHYYQAKESPEGNPALAQKYPLQLTNRKNQRTIHGSFGGGTVPWLNEAVATEQRVMIHPQDAESRGIVDGEYVTVLNDRGKLRVKAWVTEWISRGIVSLENGWWEREGGSSSILSNDTPEALSNGHSLNTTLVQVQKEA